MSWKASHHLPECSYVTLITVVEVNLVTRTRYVKLYRLLYMGTSNADDCGWRRTAYDARAFSSSTSIRWMLRLTNSAHSAVIPFFLGGGANDGGLQDPSEVLRCEAPENRGRGV